MCHRISNAVYLRQCLLFSWQQVLNLATHLQLCLLCLLFRWQVLNLATNLQLCLLCLQFSWQQVFNLATNLQLCLLCLQFSWQQVFNLATNLQLCLPCLQFSWQQVLNLATNLQLCLLCLQFPSEEQPVYSSAVVFWVVLSCCIISHCDLSVYCGPSTKKNVKSIARPKCNNVLRSERHLVRFFKKITNGNQ